MTCVIGLVSGGKVYIGADSLASNGHDKEVRMEHKVFHNGEYLIGGTSSFRMLDLLHWRFNPPTHKDGDNLLKFMCTDFVDEVRNLFSSNGYNITTSDWTSGEFLIGYSGRLFRIGSDFQVSEHTCVACGSGEYHAMGYMYHADKSKPEKSIKRGLESAEAFILSVQRPFIIKHN